VAEILGNIEGHGFALADVRYLLLTHVHADHAGGAAAVHRAIPGLQVAAAADVAEFLRRGDEKGISLDMGKKGGYYPPEYRLDPCPVDIDLAEGVTIDLGELQIKTMETPGHSSGHVVFLMDADGQKHMFSGDTLFYGGKILLQSIWDCDLQDHLDSIQRMAGLGVDVFLPGHGSFSLRDGQRHIDAANGWINRCLTPPSLF
jgi:hydroxyacylglutathione hydrolase